MIKIKKTIVRRERERERCIVLPIFRDTREPLGGKKGGGGQGIGAKRVCCFSVLEDQKKRDRESKRKRKRKRKRETETEREREIKRDGAHLQ